MQTTQLYNKVNDKSSQRTQHSYQAKLINNEAFEALNPTRAYEQIEQNKELRATNLTKNAYLLKIK